MTKCTEHEGNFTYCYIVFNASDSKKKNKNKIIDTNKKKNES